MGKLKKLGVWRELLQNYLMSRAVTSFVWGMGVAILLMMMCYPPRNAVRVLYDYPSGSTASPLSHRFVIDAAGEQESRDNLETRVYNREWESLEVRDAMEDEKVGEVEYGEMPRRFTPRGIGSFLFTQFASYRTGPKSFAVAGLGPTQLHQYFQGVGEPGFECSWVTHPTPALEMTPSDNNQTLTKTETVVAGSAATYYFQEKAFYDTVEYLTLVVHCEFEAPVGEDGKGGELRMIANRGEKRKNSGLPNVDFVAMVEEEGDYSNSSIFDEPFLYEYLYCGGPLYGPVSPHRTREWLSYHMRLFGESSHFIFYDAGGFGDEVWKILEPWVKMGRVTIMNVRQHARYDVYYYSQFLLANDCLFRAKTLAKWALFFDLDEYIHVTESAHLEQSFHDVMANMAKRGRRATNVELEQRVMSQRHCVKNDENPTAYQSQWAIENLVYRRRVNHSEWSHWRDAKAAIQPKYVLTMGVHTAANIEVPPEMYQEQTVTHFNYHYDGCENCLDDKLHYYHYHGTTIEDGDLCQEFVDPQNTTFEFDGAVYELDDSISSIATIARHFELQTLGYLQLS